MRDDDHDREARTLKGELGCAEQNLGFRRTLQDLCTYIVELTASEGKNFIIPTKRLVCKL